MRPVTRVEVGPGTPEAEPPATVELVGLGGSSGGRGGSANPGGSGRRQVDLPGAAGAVSVGREFTRRALADWGWIPDPPDRTRQTVAADVLLVISEILANAVMHAGGARALTVDSGQATGALRMEVTDGDPTVPAPPAEHRPGLPGGHGLLIVAKLSDRWGVIPGADGKTVWAEVDLTRLRDDLTAPPGS